jgi:hypothetical protein
VSNSWVNVQVALINEKQEEKCMLVKILSVIQVTQMVSHGPKVQTQRFNLWCPSGTYHLNITPMKAPEDVTSDFMNVKWYGVSLHLEIFAHFNNMVVFCTCLILCRENFEAKMGRN